jgi:hypothetical protein
VSIARTAAPAPSEAVLYRKIERDHPTLLLDEVDTIWRGGGGRNDNHDGLRALLNAGNESGVRVPRCAGPRGEQLVDFDVNCPKVLAGIGQLPETVADRSILVAMKRRTKRERVERFRRRELGRVGAGSASGPVARGRMVDPFQRGGSSPPGAIPAPAAMREPHETVGRGVAGAG